MKSAICKACALTFAGAVSIAAAGESRGFDFNGSIEKCARTGGGRVTVPGGRHFSQGPIVLRSNVELHLSDGAVVEFSDRLEDYMPGVPVSWEGNECVNVSPLVYAFGCTNVAITGKGVFKPRLGFWRTWYGKCDDETKAAVNILKNEWAEKDVPLEKRQLWKLPGAKFRPQFFHFNRCKDVRLEGFAAKGTPFWTVHFFLCEDVVARDLDIDAYDDTGVWIGNSDGIDLECTRNALVERCVFHQHDDAIVIKSGKDRDGRRLATPTENVVVRDCTVRGGPSFVAVGSELSGGIRNVLIENCRVTDEIGQLVNVKTNPRRGGFVDGLTVRGIEAGLVRKSLVGVDTLYFYGQPGEERLERELTTKVRNMTFRDIHAREAVCRLDIRGDSACPVEGVLVANVCADKCANQDVCRNVRFAEEEEPLTWGGRVSHPAVVNPVTGQESGKVISLRGGWEFSKPPKNCPNRNGMWGNFYAKQEWPDSLPVQVPSCWEAQGVGEPGQSVSWDPAWDESSKAIRRKYMGEGWYRRNVAIPAAWKGCRIWLKVGGMKSVGWIWVNDRQVALVDNYCGTEKYEITDIVTPGETAKIVVDVDNRKPSRKGLMSTVHRWGGIYRDVEIEATPQTFIDDAWVRGEFDAKQAEVHVEVFGATDGERMRVAVDGVKVEACVVEGDNVVRIPLRSFRPWSPEHPNLYTARVDLVKNGEVVHTRSERFGVRKFEVCGKEFRLNGKPFYVRGFGDDSVYPITGMSPADRDAHRANLRKARAAGFNFVRLHTHCELPEYFEAADELGVLVQAELPYYSDVPCEGFAFDPKRDVTELWRNYRRHPSFAVYSMGNEGSFGKVLDERMHRYVKALDPDRLKINQDSNRLAMNLPECADYVGGPINVWKLGSVDPDRPFITHEYLNLCVKSDSRDEAKYTGVWMPPATRESRARWLAGFGLDIDWGDRLQDAQHVLQCVWQKNGIEAARLDPYCDGYCFWTIVDVVVWNPDASAYSAQGLFNPFWERKRCGATAEDFAVFNSPSVVLCDLPVERRVFAAGDKIATDVFFAHYADEALKGSKVEWRLAAGGRTLANGAFASGDQALGPARKVGTMSFLVPTVEKPSKASLEIVVCGLDVRFSNSWDVWLFPKGPTKEEILARAAASGVTVAPKDSPESMAALSKGGRLLTVDGVKGAANVRLGWWWMGNQVGMAVNPHPALGDFPHECALTPLLFRLVKNGLPLKESDVKADEMIIVGEGGKNCYLYLAERRIGSSTVIECHGLDLLSGLPEANALLNALVTRLAKLGK